MNVVIVDNEALKEKIEDLLYTEMWEPYGMGRDMRQALAMSGEEVNFAYLEGEDVVGAMVLIVNGTTAEIRFAAVASHFRKRGIGRRLWEGIVTYITHQTNISTVELHSRNIAIHFWSSLGFKEDSPWLDHKLYEPHGIRFKIMKYNFSIQGENI
ncbi:GNAT family N-acetyltransferase [Paenibacillus radicis (ex Xue et al. 2023)]|uniref:GNAT family N-acetyltransferase n=1 Tax=Paenibacillus radicis (ex Xue et al. 2023) TaxID=2972489 RepID=A0ABT1YAQ1_9BACL|nr:GNAT family N-acetyltransferase [Paenibacillus radicis (ex Xue et al. 2023)]MCR8630274.1 GNAT family N-acetyltransferase [Paenibacillus radicis (ex Xue et al. 2023)]